MANTFDSIKQGARSVKKHVQDAKRVASIARKIQEQSTNKISGVGFWIMVGFALFKDAVDVFMHGTLVLIVLSFFVTVVAYLTLYTYLAIKGVPLWGTRRVATYAVTMIIEILPLAGAIPAFTFMVIAIRVLENNRVLKTITKKGLSS